MDHKNVLQGGRPCMLRACCQNQNAHLAQCHDAHSLCRTTLQAQSSADRVFINLVSQEQASGLRLGSQLLERQPVSETMLRLGPPLFKLVGLAIGNGLTDPSLQVTTAEGCTGYCSKKGMTLG